MAAPFSMTRRDSFGFFDLGAEFLRHPACVGLRQNKPALCVREPAEAMRILKAFHMPDAVVRTHRAIGIAVAA